jgi:hypothetical protein
MIKHVMIGDGRMVEVDEMRYNAFDSLSSNPAFMAALAQDPMFRARDAQEALAFTISQLAYTESQVFEKLYIPMQYKQLIPVTSEAGEWADSVRYEIYDFAGRGKRSSGKGDDINEVDVAYADASFPVVNGNIGYGYTSEELRRTAFLRRPISDLKLRAAIEGYERHLNAVALFGESNLTGLFNNPYVPQGNAPNGGWIAGLSANPTTYILKVIQDVNTLIFNVWQNTAFNDIVTDILLPPALFNFLATTLIVINGVATTKTLLQQLKETNLATTQFNKEITFSAGYGLDTAGSGGVNRVIGYVKNPLRLVMHVPLPLRFLAPQLVGLRVKVPGEYKYSGVAIRYPKSAYYMDGE